MTLLITGGSGTIGTALRPFLPDAVYCSHADWDVTTNASPPVLPTCILHAAAVTQHDADPSSLIETNIFGTRTVAQYCSAFHVRMVYLSTHYVYPGTTGNYGEGDDLRPVGTYAWSKLAGEAFAATVPNHLIIRGSWYTPEKLQKIAQNAVQDAWHSREAVRDAAQKIATLVTHNAQGTYNIGGARKTFAQLCVDEGILPQTITRDLLSPTLPYPFPKDSSVDTTKYDNFVRNV